MLHLFLLGLILAALWLALSGFFTPLMLGFGAFSIALVLLISYRMDVVDHEGHPVHVRPLRLTFYWIWLLKEITLSSLAVARIILSPRLPISPTVTKVNVGKLSVVAQVTYANSITLTPGSLTIELEPDGDATIHTLTRATARMIDNNTICERLAYVEEGWDGKEPPR